MPECPKCGYKVREEMSFCPNCGAPLKVEKPVAAQPAAPPPPVRYRGEKAEKQERDEKREKHEKGEKREKGEYGFMGPIIGGIVLIIIGLLSYLSITRVISGEIIGAVILVVIGVAIIIGVIYAAGMASRRYPRT